MSIFSDSFLPRIMGFQIALVLLTAVSTIIGSQAATELSSLGAYRACLHKFEACKRNNDLNALRKLREEVIRLEGQSNEDIRPLYAKLSSEINEIMKAHFEGVTEDILDKTGRLVMASQERPLKVGETQTLVQVFELAAHPSYPHHEEFMLLKRAYDRANANRNGDLHARASHNNRVGASLGVTVGINNIENNNNNVAKEDIVVPAVSGFRREELPLLHKAAKVNNLDELISILQKGTDVNGRDFEGNTPLHWAARNGHWKFIARLLLFNADKDLVNEKQQTALQLAEENGHSQAVRVLKGETSAKNESDAADCIICCEDLDAEGQALARISEHCLHVIHASCREQLIKSKRKTCPLCEQPIVDPVQPKTTIKQERNSTESPPAGFIPVRTVLPMQSVSIDELLRSASPQRSMPSAVPATQGIIPFNRSPVNASTEQRNSGLSLEPDMRLLVAASSGYVQGVCALLTQGCNVNFCDSEGITPLIAATIGGHSKVIEELMYRYNANVNMADKKGRTALYCAAANGNLPIVRLLTEGRAHDLKRRGMLVDEVHRKISENIAMTTLDHFSPLSIAVKNEHLVVAELLANWNKHEEGDRRKRYEEEQRKQLQEQREQHPNTRLLVAASSGCVQGVCTLLTEGCNVNFCDGEGITPLIAATIGGHAKVIVELMFRYNANVDTADKNGRTALYWAAATGNLIIVRLLTEGRAHNLKRSGISADEIHQRIIKSISIKALDHSCPFSIAVKNKHLAVADFLANWNKREREDRRKLLEEEQRKQLQKQQEQREHQKILEERRQEEERRRRRFEEEGRKRLEQAEQRRRAEEARKQKLLESERAAIARALARKAQEQQNKTSQRFLDEERTSRQSEQGEKLRRLQDQLESLQVSHNTLNQSNRPNRFPESGRQETEGERERIEQAERARKERNREEEQRKILLVEKQRLDARNSREKGLALIEAAKNNNGTLVASLVAEGVNINAVDKNNWTALHWACWNNCTGIAAFLLENGADIKAVMDDGRMPLHCAAWGAKKNLVELLFTYGATSTAVGNHCLTPLHFAAWNRNADVIGCLLAKGNDINAKGSFDWTPLHYAAFSGDEQFVKILLAHGADTQAVESHSKCTAVQLARNKGHNQVVNVLLAHARKG